MIQVVPEGFHTTQVVDVVEVDQRILRAQVTIAGIDIDAFNIADKVFKDPHFLEFGLAETEQVAVDNLVVPARYQSIPGISNKGKLEVAVELFACSQTMANVVRSPQVRWRWLEFVLVIRIKWQRARRNLRLRSVERPDDARTGYLWNVDEDASKLMRYHSAANHAKRPG